MKAKLLLSIAVIIAAMAGLANQPKTVVLIVQNHSTPGSRIPMGALTDALTAKFSSENFQVINPYNAVGENENRTIVGEMLPKMSAMELARGLGAQGAITASVIEFLDTTIGDPPVFHQYVMRLAFNLADAQTGGTICGETIKVQSPKYTIKQDLANRRAYLGDLMYSAAEQCAKMLKEKSVGWKPAEVQPPQVTNPPPKARGFDNLGVIDFRPKAPQTPQEKLKAMKIKTPPPAENQDFTIFDFESMFNSLVKAMFNNARFNENYQATQADKSNRPIVIIGAVTNKSVGAFAQSYGEFLSAIPDTLRTQLGEFERGGVRLFDTKDDDISKALADRILASDKSPLEDAALMEALKQHGSPDFVITSDIRLFPGPEKNKTCRFHLVLHSLYTGKIIWEGLITAIK